MTTGAFIPGDAGLWMCAALAGPVRPANVRATLSVSSLIATVPWSSKTKVPKPVAVDALGGTSCAPSRKAWNVVVEAFAGAAQIKSVSASARTTELCFKSRLFLRELGIHTQEMENSN